MTTERTVEDGSRAPPVERDRTRESCPECGGRVVADEEGVERICAECGLVVDEQELDRGPEWRAYSPDERDEKSRVGAPTTTMLHDRGLSTTIGWRDRDARGALLSTQKRQRLARLRTWDERFRARGAKDRNLKQALGEIDRMASALGVPEPTREVASTIYRRALDEDLLPGRSIEGMATAALYAASRLDGIARSIDEVESVSRVDTLELQRAYRYLVRELDLAVPPTNPVEYIGRVASELDCEPETEQCARELVDIATDRGVHSGKHPVGIAASALYAAGKLTGEELIQSDISSVANLSEVTIRNRYRDVLAAAEEADHEPASFAVDGRE